MCLLRGFSVSSAVCPWVIFTNKSLWDRSNYLHLLKERSEVKEVNSSLIIKWESMSHWTSHGIFTAPMLIGFLCISCTNTAFRLPLEVKLWYRQVLAVNTDSSATSCSNTQTWFFFSHGVISIAQTGWRQWNRDNWYSKPESLLNVMICTKSHLLASRKDMRARGW